MDSLIYNSILDRRHQDEILRIRHLLSVAVTRFEQSHNCDCVRYTKMWDSIWWLYSHIWKDSGLCTYDLGFIPYRHDPFNTRAKFSEKLKICRQLFLKNAPFRCSIEFWIHLRWLPRSLLPWSLLTTLLRSNIFDNFNYLILFFDDVFSKKNSVSPFTNFWSVF